MHDGTLELERHNGSAERTTTEERKLMDAAQNFSHFCAVDSMGQPIELSSDELIACSRTSTASWRLTRLIL